MIRLLLNGYESWEIRPYVSDRSTDPASPWHTKDGVPVASRTIRRYGVIARAKIAADLAETRQETLNRHIRQRNAIYRRRVEVNDHRTALAILDSLAKLQGLTPEGMLAEQLRLAGAGSGALRREAGQWGRRRNSGNWRTRRRPPPPEASLTG